MLEILLFIYRENAELHRHLDELLLSVAPFDNLHKDDVCMQEELQATKVSSVGNK